MSTRTVLVLGASGRFGQAASVAFAAAGWQVIAQSRRRPEAMPAGVLHLALGLDDVAALAGAARAVAGPGQRIDALVYAVNPAYTDWEREQLPLARRGMDLAARLGAHFLLPGNVYAYGAQMPALLREDTPERPTTSKGRLRAALEAELRQRTEVDGTAAGSPLRATVIRAGDFYGAGRGSWLDLAVAKSLPAGKLVYPGPLDVPHAWAYLPDLARAFVAVAERAAVSSATPACAAFETLHFAGHTLTGAELLAHVEAAAADLGITPAAVATRGWRHAGMPWGLIRLGGVVVPMLRAIAEMSYLWRVPHALDGSRLATRVGALPATPPRQALRQALVDLGFGARAIRPVTAH